MCKLEELPEAAHRKWQEHNLDYDWWEFVYEDAKEIGTILGIRVDNIYFSGFWNQGDGACIEGRYNYAKESCKKIRERAPQDKELHRIADTLYAIQKRFFYGIVTTVQHTGRYYHNHSVSFAHYTDPEVATELFEDDLEQVLRDFMDWVYKRLENEYEYLQSFESFKDACSSMDYEFSEEGDIK
jgi:hypothetical protein